MKIFLIFFIFFGFRVSCQRADFFREDITFRLDSTNFDVDGYYWFANTAAETIHSEIFYPFLNDKNVLIDSIRLYNLSSGKACRYKREDGSGISFQLKIPPFDTVLFQIGYRQKVVADSVLYILQTTQGWGKPIDLAEYKLIVPDYFRIKQFSYQPDKSYKMEKYNVYYWKKENFMPDQDMIFNF